MVAEGHFPVLFFSGEATRLIDLNKVNQNYSYYEAVSIKRFKESVENSLGSKVHSPVSIIKTP